MRMYSKTDPSRYSYGSLLEPDQPVPTAPARVGAGRGEHRLAMGVLERALEDLREGAAHARRRRGHILRKRRERYCDLVGFFRDRSARWGTLAYWCSFLDMDAEWLRERVEGLVSDLDAGLDAARVRLTFED